MAIETDKTTGEKFLCTGDTGHCWCMDLPPLNLPAVGTCMSPSNPAFADIPTQPITDRIMQDKYAAKLPDGTLLEKTRGETFLRVAQGIFDGPGEEVLMERSYAAMLRGDWVPAGRILAGAGLDNRVTLINCYVSPTIEDSLVSEKGTGIMQALTIAAETQQMGGGIGMDFSSIRPSGAIVKRTGSVSSGVLPFMDMWHAMCGTIQSSGSRRGAMMGTLRIDHADVIDFIKAKRTAGRLTNFNVSVLITDAFMEAVKEDSQWELGFPKVPRADGKSKGSRFREDFQVYETVRARDLWDLITRSTYEYAEPGVIFIDRVNAMNNLWYVEKISCTNPCGEQPLPPNGACNLGAINLATMVREPFSQSANVDMSRLAATAELGMRFLDKVLDKTLFPTEEQAHESINKRRTGLGITGLATMLQQLGLRYGSKEAVAVTKDVMRTIRDAAYRTSVHMAMEKGPFPLFKAEDYCLGKFIKKLPEDLQMDIRTHGIRNSVLLTIAPTGTTSLAMFNPASGCEPPFAFTYTRKVREADNSYTTYDVQDYGYLLYKRKYPDAKVLPPYMVTTDDLTVEDHIVMQAACQEFVDSSISKTINCAPDMTFEVFQNVYRQAYDAGLKGCTTYRPSGIRGAVLTKTEEKKPETPELPKNIKVKPREEELEGCTYKIRWNNVDNAFYVTINDVVDEQGNRQPFEIFINSKSVQHQEFIAALTRTISAVFRRGGDLTFLVDELTQVHSVSGGQFINQQYVPSLVAYIGRTIEKHFKKIGLIPVEMMVEELTKPPAPPEALGNLCPSCYAPTYVKREGCGSCLTCGYSTCS